MERTETPVLWRKPPVTEIPVPVAAAPAPYSALKSAVYHAAKQPSASSPAGTKDLRLGRNWVRHAVLVLHRAADLSDGLKLSHFALLGCAFRLGRHPQHFSHALGQGSGCEGF